MAMRSKFFVVGLGIFFNGSVDPVAASRVQNNDAVHDSELNTDAENVEWDILEYRCARLQRNFNTAVSMVRTKANRASQNPGLVSTARLVTNLRQLTRHFQIASDIECSWVSEQDADTDTMLSVAHENMDGNPCLPQARKLMAGADQSNADDMSIAAVQAMQMLISGNCTAIVLSFEATAEQPAIEKGTMEEINDDVIEELEVAALEAEDDQDDQDDGSLLVELDTALEQKPHAGAPPYAGTPAHRDNYRPGSTAVRAVVGGVLFILSLGFLCAVGPAFVGIIALIAVSIIVLFLAFFFTFIAVALQANPATGNTWLFSYLRSTWGFTAEAIGMQLVNGAHWLECFAYLR